MTNLLLTQGRHGGTATGQWPRRHSLNPVARPRRGRRLAREISFNRQDQWAAISEPGRFPLILDPCINSVRFEHVLVDGGSSIDILFHNSLPALKLTPTQLKPYDAQFWGVLLL